MSLLLFLSRWTTKEFGLQAVNRVFAELKWNIARTVSCLSIHRLQYLRITLISSWTRFRSYYSDNTSKTFPKANVLKLNGCWIDVFFHTKGNSKTWYIRHHSSWEFPCQLWTQISSSSPIILSETVTDPLCSLNAAISKTFNNQYSLFQRYPPLVPKNYPNFKVNNKLGS